MKTDKFLTSTLKECLENKKQEYSYFKLNEMNILPCRGCGSCGHKTPGKCAYKDDMPIIMKDLAKSEIVILLTPITFGGYSSELKKAVDKFTLIGLPLYLVKDGHLLHPTRYSTKSLIVIGVIQNEMPGQEENFNLLVENNALNIHYEHKTIFLKSLEDKHFISQKINSVLNEVLLS